MMREVANRYANIHSNPCALFIGNLTIDIVGNRCRVGGSGFYGGVALSEYLGVETHVYTTVDDVYEPMIKSVLAMYGIRMWSSRCCETTTFEIVENKAYRIAKRGCVLRLEEVEAIFDVVKPSMIFVTPVAREISLEDAINLVEILKHRTKTISIDIQGFVRSISEDGLIRCRWEPQLRELLVKATVVHGNESEFCLENSLEELISISKLSPVTILMSLDSRGCIVVRNGKALRIPAPHVNPVDEVGAGDVLTAVTSYYIALGLDPIEAAARGVAAASLKVENSYGRWFDEDSIQKLSRYILRYSQPLNDDFSLR